MSERSHQPILLSGGRVIDPGQGIDAVLDVLNRAGAIYTSARLPLAPRLKSSTALPLSHLTSTDGRSDNPITFEGFNLRRSKT